MTNVGVTPRVNGPVSTQLYVYLPRHTWSRACKWHGSAASAASCFSIRVDHVPAKPTQEIPDHVQAEFHRHSCALCTFWGV